MRKGLDLKSTVDINKLPIDLIKLLNRVEQTLKSDVNQQTLAIKTGIQQSDISRIRRGRKSYTNLSLRNMARLASFPSEDTDPYIDPIYSKVMDVLLSKGAVTDLSKKTHIGLDTLYKIKQGRYHVINLRIPTLVKFIQAYGKKQSEQKVR